MHNVGVTYPCCGDIAQYGTPLDVPNREVAATGCFTRTLCVRKGIAPATCVQQNQTGFRSSRHSEKNVPTGLDGSSTMRRHPWGVLIDETGLVVILLLPNNNLQLYCTYKTHVSSQGEAYHWTVLTPNFTQIGQIMSYENSSSGSHICRYDSNVVQEEPYPHTHLQPSIPPENTPGPSRQVICVVNGPLAEAGEGVAYIGKLIPGMWVRGTWFAQQQNGHNHDRQPNTFLDISLFQKKWPPSHCNEYRATGYQVLGFGAYRAVTYWAVA